jgi:hypothetical protein
VRRLICADIRDLPFRNAAGPRAPAVGRMQGRDPVRFIKLGVLAVLVVMLVGAFGLWTSFRVARRAADVAGSSPYCIQVARAGNYGPARSLLDISGLRMWARGGGAPVMHHHAILVVEGEPGPKLLHWSYRRGEFVPGVLNERMEGYGAAITCEPKPDFAGGLPLVVSQTSGADYVRFSGQEAYRIPGSFHAKWSGGSSRSLQLAAGAPDFLPLAFRLDDLTFNERDANSIWVDWRPDWLLRLMKSTPRGTLFEEGTEHGLQKTRIVSQGRDSEEYVGYRYLVHADGQPDGINTTLISCSMPSEAFPKTCQHRFLHDGRHFYFRHRPEDVPNWRGMQARVVGLFASFQVRSATP